MLSPGVAALVPPAYLAGVFVAGVVVGAGVMRTALPERWRSAQGGRHAGGVGPERAGEQFVTRMGHELRTPLNSVIGFSTILLKNAAGNLTTRQLLFLGRIRDNGLHLLALVDHLLDATGEAAGPPRVRLAPVSIAHVVRGAVDELADEAAVDNVTVETELPFGLAPITTDEHRFQLAFRSLVRGALPLAEQGSITVRVAALEGRPERIDIAVSGSGRGDGIAMAQEPEVRGVHPAESTSLPAGVTLATSLYHLLGYSVTTERTSEHEATFSVRLARPVVETPVAPHG